jgi:hypothetical protein
MKKLILVSLVIGCVILSGCTSAVSSFTTPKQNLKLNEQAVFERDAYAFTVGIDHIDVQKQSSGARDVTVTFRVTNTGTKGTTLTLSPRFTDSSSNEYATSSIFFSQITPGYSVAKKGTITVPSEDAYAALSKNAVLSVRVQGASPTAYEASWDVDAATLIP